MPVRKFLFYWWGFLSLTLLATMYVAYCQLPPRQLEVYVLDIGQGDGTLIRTPYGRTIVIDGGPDLSVLAQLGRILPYLQRTIDLLILTHPDADHLIGALAILQRYRVRYVLVTDVQDDSALYEAWHKQLQQRNIPVLLAGQVRAVSLGKNLQATILYPKQSIAEKKFSQVNDSSIVTRFDFGTTALLFPGDATIFVERQLLEIPGELAADVLQAGHHGSNTSSSQEFVQAVQPNLVVISAGKNNRYNHPSQLVLERFNRLGIPWLLTARNGTVRLTSDGRKISAYPSRFENP